MQEDSDEGDGKKKVRGPISAERKFKKKVAVILQLVLNERL